MASSPVIMRIGPSGDSSKTQFNEHRCNMLKFRLEHAGYRVIVEHADSIATRTVVLLHRGRIVAKCDAVESVIPKNEVERLLRAVDAPQPGIRRKRLRGEQVPRKCGLEKRVVTVCALAFLRVQQLKRCVSWTSGCPWKSRQSAWYGEQYPFSHHRRS